MQSESGITVRDIRRAIHGLSDDAEVVVWILDEEGEIQIAAKPVDARGIGNDDIDDPDDPIWQMRLRAGTLGKKDVKVKEGLFISCVETEE